MPNKRCLQCEHMGCVITAHPEVIINRIDAKLVKASLEQLAAIANILQVSIARKEGCK